MSLVKMARAVALPVLVSIFASAMPVASQAQVVVSVDIAPPQIPVYTQPLAPAQNDIWTPGYWAWGPAGYYWVPGTWVAAPRTGYLWTPGYWGAGGSGYAWNPGYWGPQVGFYGGINYGFGYWGNGYYGGRWDGNVFRYNTAVTRVNTTIIHNTYVDRTVVRQNFTNRTSYNGGRGGITARPTPDEVRYAHAEHLARTPEQQQHEEAAAHDRNQAAAVNHGKPPKPATVRPLPAAKDTRNEPTADDRKAAQAHVQPSKPADQGHKPPRG